jgi:methionine synthase II (cobalamin-independent)
MFATILGRLPRPPDVSPGDASPADAGAYDAVRRVIATQERLGLEPISDGRLGVADADLARALLKGTEAGLLEAWRFASACTTRVVKQALPGPYTIARGLRTRAAREAATLTVADRLNREVRTLRDAGCQIVEVDEPAAVTIGDDARERRLFVEAHRRLTAGVDGIHLSLALTRGNADTAGPETILDAPYASYAVDLIAGPDNWRLVTRVPGDRGIVCGALSAEPGANDGPELLVWAAQYAASTGGRGLDRVGLASVPGLERLDWAVVERKLERLAEGARLAGRDARGELVTALDPRAVSSKSAALGRYAPRARGRARRDG